MNHGLFRSFLLTLGFVASTAANATFHLWQMSQLYSSADGSVQYIQLVALASGQQFLAGHTITSAQGPASKSFTFPSDLPGDTASGDGGIYGGGTSFKSMLIGTQGFAALDIVRPDYVVPNGFLFLPNGIVNFGEGSDIFVYPGLPTTGGLALIRSGATAVGSMLNFAGESGRITATVAPPAASLENPQPGSFQSGIGLISGWSCEGPTITVSIDGTPQRAVPYGSSRGDTASICGAGNINTGFGLLFNYNGLGTGAHTAQVFVNGTARGNPVQFTVTAPSGEFLSGAAREVTVPNFPTPGRTTTLIWQEAQQNFAIKSVAP